MTGTGRTMVLLRRPVRGGSGNRLADSLLTGGTRSQSRSAADHRARKRSPDAAATSPSLSYKPHTAHHSLGTLVRSAGLVYFLSGIWRAPQPMGAHELRLSATTKRVRRCLRAVLHTVCRTAGVTPGTAERSGSGIVR